MVSQASARQTCLLEENNILWGHLCLSIPDQNALDMNIIGGPKRFPLQDVGAVHSEVASIVRHLMYRNNQNV